MRTFWAAIGILVVSAIAWAAWERAKPEPNTPAAQEPAPGSRVPLPAPDLAKPEPRVETDMPPLAVGSAPPDSNPPEEMTVPPIASRDVDQSVVPPQADPPRITGELDVVSQPLPVQKIDQAAPVMDPPQVAAQETSSPTEDARQESVAQPEPAPTPAEQAIASPAAPSPAPSSPPAPTITVPGTAPTPSPSAGVTLASPALREAEPKNGPAAKDDTAAPVAAFQTSPTPADIQTKDDGSLLIDKRFVVKGKGTKEDPYKVSWDLLVSAQEDFQPKQGRKNLPQRVMMFDGKHVEISGNISFPMMSQQPRELLAMLNPWDGCCIGIPPTPYDAVEVSLKSTVTGDARFTTFGSVKGVLKVDPHMVGNWLVGLYVMKDGELTPKSYGGFAP